MFKNRLILFDVKNFISFKLIGKYIKSFLCVDNGCLLSSLLLLFNLSMGQIISILTIMIGLILWFNIKNI